MIRIEGRTRGGGWFVAGAVLDDGRVVRCAPIIKYMRGWNTDRVFLYCKQRKWKAVLYP